MAKNKAICIHRFGGPDVLQFEDIPTPQPEENEVVVRVHAASANPVDYKTRDGHYPMVKQDALPLVLGRGMSGTVEMCGSNVQAVRPGDAVYAMVGTDRGTFARFVVVKPAEMARKPDGLSHIEAAAVPLAGLTAWQGLFDEGGLQAGQRVLIHSGAGGVGHLAIQFAKAKGAKVFTTAGERDLDFVRSLGVDEAIDYKSQRFEDVARDIDLVFDLIAGETQERSWAVLKPGGILVSTLSEPSEEQARARNARGVRFMAHPDGRQLAEIGRLIENGKVRPVVSQQFPLDQARKAQETLEHDHPRGKVVLYVTEQI